MIIKPLAQNGVRGATLNRSLALDDPRARQIAFNSLSRDQWGSFESHRARVTELLGRDAGKGRLCVLGAGNCNDLDLKALLGRHREIHLVDLDASALADGIARQELTGHPAVIAHGGIDLTGMLEAIARWNPAASISRADLNALAELPGETFRMAFEGPFESVASTCLLSQLIANIKHSIGENHPRFIEAVQSIRLGHLRLLARLVRPGGWGTLVTDVVSSDTLPNLKSLPENALRELMPVLNRGRNFFHGVNPAILWPLFRQDPLLAAATADLEGIPPWRWDFQIRMYLVVAFRFRSVGNG